MHILRFFAAVMVNHFVPKSWKFCIVRAFKLFRATVANSDFESVTSLLNSYEKVCTIYNMPKNMVKFDRDFKVQTIQSFELLDKKNNNNNNNNNNINNNNSKQTNKNGILYILLNHVSQSVDGILKEF